MTSPWLLVFAPYAASYFFSYLLRNVNAVVAPALQGDFGLAAGDLGLLTAAYLVGFALMQLPVGLLLDRHGPRRVLAILLLLAAAGCGLFAHADSLGALVLARGLIGVGVSASLMAAFKAFSLAFPASQRAAVNAAIMAAGGLGALSATVPLNALLGWVNWPTIFLALAGLGFLLAALLWRTADVVGSGVATGDWQQLLRELAAILACPAFRRFAPLTGLMVGGFIAIQGLWSAFWLAEVQGLGAMATAHTLLQLNIGLIGGYTAIALLLLRPPRNISLPRILAGGSLSILLCQVAIVGQLAAGAWLWLVYGICSALMNVAYTAHAAHYPLHRQGRANTCLNLVIFVCAFAIQWGFGAAIDLGRQFGWPAATSLRAIWVALIGLQLLALFVFLVAGPGRLHHPD